MRYIFIAMNPEVSGEPDGLYLVVDTQSTAESPAHVLGRFSASAEAQAVRDLLNAAEES